MAAGSDDRGESEGTALPAVREVLALPEVAAGLPEILTGEDGLGRRVRWAHVVAGSAAAALLDGGEVVLTTGVGWPRDPASLAEAAETLAAADPAAVILELGTGFASAPAELVASCLSRGIPFVVLHREVRFVQITQRIHQRVLAAQNEVLRARAAVHTMLTELGLNRSPADYVVGRLAGTLNAPVVLEDAARRVVAWTPAGSRGAGGEDEVLRPWAEAQRDGTGTDPALPSGATRVPVEARGQRWGFLTALAGEPHPAGRATVLELGAFALALGRLADADGEQWLEIGSRRLLDAVLEGRYRSERDLALQLESAGLPVQGRVLLGATLAGTGEFGSGDAAECEVLRTALYRSVGPDVRVLAAQQPGSARAFLALLSFPDGVPPSRTDGIASVVADRLGREIDALVPGGASPSWRVRLALGVPARTPKALIASLERIVVSAGSGLPAVPGGVRGAGRVQVQAAERRPLVHLVQGLSSLPAVQEFAASLLGPLIDHDLGRGAGRSGDLLRVLAAYLAHPTNRSLAAQESRLSRSVFYQRIALIEDLLGVDLADGETIAALTVALLAHGATGTPDALSAGRRTASR